ncbi:hypothetical protein JAAARDRAFT_206263 [Jaapia argillacea MUCL 33604]|uniref:Uncharacterized protein n=1 Tax=Jaapia argillacea MUCL 33604 TaxID=933084 RepID=A0A067Q6S6_9AGAM|nr:hypothetical protein JAAARDRAFT_206263 [Jaapia argillacea MUCL 33604]
MFPQDVSYGDIDMGDDFDFLDSLDDIVIPPPFEEFAAGPIPQLLLPSQNDDTPTSATFSLPTPHHVPINNLPMLPTMSLPDDNVADVGAILDWLCSNESLPIPAAPLMKDLDSFSQEASSRPGSFDFILNELEKSSLFWGLQDVPVSSHPDSIETWRHQVFESTEASPLEAKPSTPGLKRRRSEVSLACDEGSENVVDESRTPSPKRRRIELPDDLCLVGDSASGSEPIERPSNIPKNRDYLF